jgi:hypothetical protein
LLRLRFSSKAQMKAVAAARNERAAIVEGVADGTPDLTSHHLPGDIRNNLRPNAHQGLQLLAVGVCGSAGGGRAGPSKGAVPVKHGESEQHFKFVASIRGYYIREARTFGG